MNKDEKVLASTTANGMREITQERAKQAMQEQAIAFAEWIVYERWKIEFKQQRHFTTAELYTLFNTNNTNNGE